MKWVKTDNIKPAYPACNGQANLGGTLLSGPVCEKAKHLYSLPLSLFPSLERKPLKDCIKTNDQKENGMKLSESVKSISYLKANAAKMIEDANKNQKTFVITQNGEAKVIVQDLKAYEKTQETLALLKILSLSSKIFKAGRLKE